MRSRITALVIRGLAVVPLALGLLAAVPEPAGAANPTSHYVGTWNLQGSNHSSENKWNEGVATLMTAYRLVALQEAGTVPSSARRNNTFAVTVPGGRQWTVEEYLWQGTQTRPGLYVYWLQTDPAGNRVNLALVSASRADHVEVVEGPYRPALGIRIGADYYFSVHGSAGNGGGDVSRLLQNIDDAVTLAEDEDDDFTWVALGDFNREPDSLREALPDDLGLVVCDPAAPTHPATNPQKRLDYMVRSTDSLALTGHVLALHMSDHLPVRYSFPPTDLAGDALDARHLRVMPLGDSITAGEGSSHGAGYRRTLWDLLAGRTGTTDFVGSLRSGDVADGDHQGHSGRRIDEIATAARCPVRQYRPNVVTLHAGTNDMNQNHDLVTAPERMGELIDQILRDAPDATVLVATLVPAAKEGLQPRIDAYNAALPGIVEERRNQGKHVRLVDMSLVTPRDLAQPAHPGDSGYLTMGHVFYGAIADAVRDGWIEDPVAAPGPGGSCTPPEEPESAAGPGWRSLGVIAPGMTYPEGRTDLVELNGDSRADYVRISDHGEVRAALNTPGEPGRPDWVEIDSGVGATDPGVPGSGAGVRFADINGDGRDDLLDLGPDSSVVAYENQGVDKGRIRWSPRGLIAPGVSGATREQIRFADVDGDGRDDYLRVSEQGAVHAYLNTLGDDGLIHWREWRNWAPGVSYGSRDKLRLADVEGDGRADYLMVGSDGSVHAYLNRRGSSPGDPSGGHGPGFVEKLNFVNATGYPGDKSAFRDISGDGRADYVVIYQGGSIRCWLNRGGNM
ncbi:GDSL-type esterase/lipase family protein [Streptomyces sp. YIM 98790]|uniref:GDSL-type esterase/lipase family protein n=1 Tax=Streptomyces sp. YIM 98790 TaxID=2689077 RepID=UPI00140994EA|nr:GDSL-type esterase/lipase family protein [Streptomyces sp. YIM 98790]